MNIQTVPIATLHEDPKNARLHPDANLVAIKEALSRFGQRIPLVVRNNTVIAGNGRLRVMRELGWADVAVVLADDLTENEAKAFAIADNRTSEMAEWNTAVLQEILDGLGTDDIDLSAMGLADADLDALLNGVGTGSAGTSMSDKYTNPPTRMTEVFGAPPFSVLDGRKGYWLERKREWFDLGIMGEAGRPNAVAQPDEINDGISVMDPVLCELLYAWFCPPGGTVVNPMAGESVYGIVSGCMGRPYYGIELRKEQIDTNEIQAEAINMPAVVEWAHGDGRDVAALAPDADFIMCCPPYFDLEVYSDQEEDLSTCGTYEEFLEAYRAIVAGSVEILNNNRFATFVVGDVRDQHGNYRNFVSDTVQAFMDVGMHLYNEAILLTPIGTLPFRAGKTFKASRKLGKAHQNVLVFLKGDAKLATEACGPVSRINLETDA